MVFWQSGNPALSPAVIDVSNCRKCLLLEVVKGPGSPSYVRVARAKNRISEMHVSPLCRARNLTNEKRMSSKNNRTRDFFRYSQRIPPARLALTFEYQNVFVWIAAHHVTVKVLINS